MQQKGVENHNYFETFRGDASIFIQAGNLKKFTSKW
jgi:hypothetical protein